MIANFGIKKYCEQKQTLTTINMIFCIFHILFVIYPKNYKFYKYLQILQIFTNIYKSLIALEFSCLESQVHTIFFGFVVYRTPGKIVS